MYRTRFSSAIGTTDSCMKAGGVWSGWRVAGCSSSGPRPTSITGPP